MENKEKIDSKSLQKVGKLKASPQEYLKFNIKINQDGKKKCL